MKGKLFFSLAVLLLSGTAFFVSDASAVDSPQSSDPNVVALKASAGAKQCYLQESDKSCKRDVTMDFCALCDGDVVIKPSTPPTDGPQTAD